MEFNFNICGFQGREISIWDAGALAHLDQLNFHKLRNVLEEFGQRSAAAQGLRAPVTDIYRLRSSDQRLYLHILPAAVTSSSCTVLGGLKIGRKKLFLHRVNGAIAEVEPLCVLDFYVHESYQRQGVGKALFEYMLAAEGHTPEQLGYDRPSPKLLAFLHKHYHLSSYVPQTNNFVVYEQYFQTKSSKSSSASKELVRQHINSVSLVTGPSSSSSSCHMYTSGGCRAAPAGRQNVHVVGSNAAAELEGAGYCPEQWVSASVRPPTASLKQSVQLNQSNVQDDSWGTRINSPAVALAAALGGPGCAPAGAPTYGANNKCTVTGQQPVLQSGSICYARGAGVKNLQQGPAGSEGNTYRDFQQALYGAAAHPAPVVRAADSVQQQQSRVLQAGCRDSLDDFQLNVYKSHNNINSVSLSSSGAQEAGSSSAGGSQESSWPAIQSATSQLAQPGGVGQQYEVIAPYGTVQPPPWARLTNGKPKAMQTGKSQQQEQRRISTSTLPDHLLAAPTNSYAVPTAGMAGVISKHGQFQLSQQPGWESQQQQQAAGAPNLLAWDGLPPGRRQTATELGLAGPGPPAWWQACNSRTERCCPTGRLPGATAADGNRAMPGQSRGSMGSADGQLGAAKAAAANHRAGSAAADCLKMF